MQSVELDIPVSRLTPAPYNPRGTFSDDSVAELVVSLPAHGQAHNLVVRFLRKVARRGGHAFVPCPASEDPVALLADPDVVVEIVCGNRRHRAATLAGLPALRCHVRLGMTDEEAIELSLVENALKEEVSPLGEATALARLSGLGVDLAAVARRIKHNKRWLTHRRDLLSLPLPLQEAIRRGQITITSAAAIAALPEAAQKKVTAEVLDLVRRHSGEQVPHRLVLEALGGQQRLLRLAPWDLGDDRLGERGACTGCPMRSGAQPDLWGIPGQEERCLQESCWKTKMAEHAAHLKRTEGLLNGAPPVLEYVPVKAPVRLLPPSHQRLGQARQAGEGTQTWADLVPDAKQSHFLTPTGRVESVILQADLEAALEAKGLHAELAAVRPPPPRAPSQRALERERPTPAQADELLGEAVRQVEMAWQDGEALPWAVLLRPLVQAMSSDQADRAARRRALYESETSSHDQLLEALEGMPEREAIGLLFEAVLGEQVSLAIAYRAPRPHQVADLMGWLAWCGVDPLPGMAGEAEVEP